jgi:cysteine synthase
MPIIRGSERDKLYQRVASCIVETPLYKIHNIAVPNGCQIFCKEEYLNPTGSHYDRFWVDYLRKQEDKNHLSITDTLIETSTGNSGASFAWTCRALGFKDYHVVIPEDMPSVRIKQICELGATVKLSPAEEYVDGLIKTFNLYYEEMKALSSNPQTIKRPNHSRYGDMSIETLAKIADEIILELRNKVTIHRSITQNCGNMELARRNHYGF